MRLMRGWLIAALVWVGGPQRGVVASEEPTPPDVVMIVVDDMNDWIGCLDGGRVDTPNIDRLAARGVVFSNAHCAAPVCNPSRTATLTGLRPATTGIYGNDQWWRPVLGDVDTIPSYFRQHGYATIGAGKIFHHTAGFNPPDQWDAYFQQVHDNPWDLIDRRNYPFVPDTPVPDGYPYSHLSPRDPEFDFGVLPGKSAGEYGDALAVDYIVGQMAQPSEKPRLFALGLFHPHLPWYAPPEFFDRVNPLPRDIPPIEVPADDLEDIPTIGRKFAAASGRDLRRVLDQGKWHEAVEAYLAAIAFADAQIGRLLDALDARPNAPPAVIVFYSDHGYHVGEKEHWNKSTLWERATHVPLVVVAPGVARAGATCAAPASLLDLFPTLIELCGLPKNAALDGMSLAPWLKSPETPRAEPALTTYLVGNHALRTDRWRYIRYADGGEELYDHQADPNEWTNLADRPRYASVKSELARWLPTHNAPPAPSKGAYRFDPKTYEWKKKQP